MNPQHHRTREKEDLSKSNHDPSSSSLQFHNHHHDSKSVTTSLFLKGWWVFLMVNLSSKANRTTQIKMHKNPELAMLQSNTNKNKDQNMWTILMRVGGFENKRKASEFYEYWNKKSRGLCSRIAKGISLVKKYHETDNITMWTTSRSKENMISFFNEHRLWLESSNSFMMDRRQQQRTNKDKLRKRIGRGDRGHYRNRHSLNFQHKLSRVKSNIGSNSCHCNRKSK